MSLLDKLEQLKTQMTGYRGELDKATESNLENWHEQIRENQQLMDFLMSPGGKILTKEAKKMLAVVDKDLLDRSLEDNQIYKLLALKEAWTNILQLLMGSPERIKAIEAQLDYELE